MRQQIICCHILLLTVIYGRDTKTFYISVHVPPSLDWRWSFLYEPSSLTRNSFSSRYVNIIILTRLDNRFYINTRHVSLVEHPCKFFIFQHNVHHMVKKNKKKQLVASQNINIIEWFQMETLLFGLLKFSYFR